MKWIPATERLPSFWAAKSVRFIHTKIQLLDAKRWLSENPNGINVIEWLDESSTSVESYSLSDIKEHNPDYIPPVTGDSEEVERRTRIIEKLVKDDSMYHVHVQESYKEHRWQQFKKENNL